MGPNLEPFEVDLEPNLGAQKRPKSGTKSKQKRDQKKIGRKTAKGPKTGPPPTSHRACPGRWGGIIGRGKPLPMED